MRTLYRFAAAAALCMCSPAVLAHHSFAMFDLTKEVSVEAVVKEMQYTNPHVWIQILVPDDNGGETEWSIESGAPGMMTRAGWKSSTLKPGDKVTLVMHPLKSGKPSGSLVSVTVPDGRVLGPGAGEVPPPRTTAPTPAK
jgi:hypothetical protein